MRRICMIVGAVGAMSLLTACGGGESLTDQITNGLKNTGWSYDVSASTSVLSVQWFGDGWTNRDTSPDGGTNWCRMTFNWSIDNAVDPYTFTIVYVAATDACNRTIGTEERFRFHMNPDANGWSTSGRWLPGEPADSSFDDNALLASQCATDAAGYASGCSTPNGAPAAP